MIWTVPLYAILAQILSAQAYEGWSSLGCFLDGGGTRVLHHQVGSFTNNTVSSCLATCTAQNFALAGVEYGSECFCGNTILYGYGTARPGSCYMRCSGNSEETCGGPDAIEIYRRGNLPYTSGPASLLRSWNGWIVTQCWQDDMWPFGSPRLLPHYPKDPIPAEQMTVQRCILGCEASHYTSAGLEWGQECWCGNVTYPPGQSTSEYQCSMPCLGDATQTCGGPQRATLYLRRV